MIPPLTSSTRSGSAGFSLRGGRTEDREQANSCGRSEERLADHFLNRADVTDFDVMVDGAHLVLHGGQRARRVASGSNIEEGT
jgi:hypothetical protein